MEATVVLAVLAYISGALITLRRAVYWTKETNDGREYAGHILEPRLYSKREYEDLRDPFARVFPSSDYRDVVASALFFPVYWMVMGFWFARGFFTELLFSDPVDTPEELQRLEEETERMRREQDGA